MGKLGTSNIYMRKNMLINGDMRIAQRSDAVVTGIGVGDTGYYTVDRWRFKEEGTIGGECSMSQEESDVPAGSGHQSALKIDVTTAEAAVAATELVAIDQKIEAQDLQHLLWGNGVFPKSVNFSFWLKSVTKSGTMCIYLNQLDGARTYTHEITITAGSWEFHSVPIPGDIWGGMADDNGSGLNVGLVLVAGGDFQGTADQWNTGTTDFATSNQDNFWDHTDNELWLTGAQLELGSKFTGFDFRPFSEELMACERYFYTTYQSIHPVGTATNSSAWGHNWSRGSKDYRVNIPWGTTRMRTTPTVTFYSGTTGDPGKIRNQVLGADVTFSTVGGSNGEVGCSDNDIGTAPTNGDKHQGQYACDAEL